MLTDFVGLQGKVAVVTGAGGGIGASIAEVLASAGAFVICADLDEDSAATVADKVAASGCKAEARVADVASRTSVDALISGVVADHGRLDILCNNAGIMVDRPALEITEEEFDRVMAVNLKGVLFGCQAAGRVMDEGGRIINTVSTIVDQPSVGRIAYGASKAGVVQLTRFFALELGARGIRVNAVAPGWLVTGITGRHFTEPDGSVDEKLRDEIVAQRATASPLGAIGETKDIAYAVLFLSSELGRYWTGQVLRPNGGSTMA
jgi:3-oxoacyl-[acyl-carrier protein] reductase